MPGNSHLKSQKPSRPTADPFLNGYQLPQDINFRRLYDALKIITNDIKDLQRALFEITQMQPVSPITISVEKGLTEQTMKRTEAYDILKRVSTRL